MKTATHPPRRAWTPREVANMIGLSKSTVYLLLTTGELYGFRYGSRWVIPDAAVAAYLDGRAYKPTKDEI